MGFFRAPFFNMISFSTKCGIGLKGRRIIMMENTMSIEYGILSRNDHMKFPLSQTNRMLELKLCHKFSSIGLMQFGSLFFTEFANVDTG